MSKSENMSKSDVIRTFNDILSDFLQQISPLIGTSYQRYFKMLTTVNSTAPIKHFIDYVHNPEKPLDKQIETRDEKYFTNVDNHKDTLQNHDSMLMEIVRLQSVYEQLSKDSKDNVWDILQSLLYLSKKYMS